jgi:hypothetical protein
MDNAKLYYVRVTQNELNQCKKLNNKKIVCNHELPLQISHSSSECEALMLQPVREVPKRCNQRILELRETLWTPLKKFMAICSASA